MASEATWLPWLAGRRLPPVAKVQGRVLVLSAHPDDEVLGVGGFLADLAGRPEVEVEFCTVTDGEGSHPGSPTYQPSDLSLIRALELTDALAELGYAHPEVTRLGLPDTGLDPHSADLHALVTQLVDSADLVLSPSRTDGHGDHDALGAVAARACGDRVTLWEYPIWTWVWTEPDDPDVPWGRARRIEVPPGAQERKQAAIARFTSQVSPLSEHDADRAILPATVLEHFDRPFEVVFA